MIPEFPLPTVDADFYKSKMCQLAPIFGCITSTPKLVEPTSFLHRDSTAAESLLSNCIENAVKRAVIHQRNIVRASPIQSRTFSTSPFASLISAVSSVTQ